MSALDFIILGVIVTGIIYLFLVNRKPADVVPFNSAEREAFNKARLDLEKGAEEARAKYLAKREEYEQLKKKFTTDKKHLVVISKNTDISTDLDKDKK